MVDSFYYDSSDPSQILYFKCLFLCVVNYYIKNNAILLTLTLYIFASFASNIREKHNTISVLQIYTSEELLFLNGTSVNGK